MALKSEEIDRIGNRLRVTYLTLCIYYIDSTEYSMIHARTLRIARKAIDLLQGFSFEVPNADCLMHFRQYFVFVKNIAQV